MNPSTQKVVDFCKATKGEWFLQHGYKLRHKQTRLCPICQYAKVTVNSTWDSFAWNRAAIEANLSVNDLFNFVMAADGQNVIQFGTYEDWYNNVATLRKELLIGLGLGAASSN